MENSVISSIKPRIEYYTTAVGITSAVQKKEYVKQIDKLGEEMTHARILFLRRSLESFDLAMGEKNDTTHMYLKGDIHKIKQTENTMYPTDKTSGRGFVEVMKQNSDTSSISEENSNLSNGKSLTKVDTSSSAYKIFNNAA